MKLLIAFVFFIGAPSLHAQPKLPVLKSFPSIKSDIQKVAADYFRNFENTRGEIVFENSNTVQFASRVVPPGASNVTVTKYKSPQSYSWQATMFQAEDFKEAVLKYKQYFRQLDGATFNLNGSSYKISGIYDAPDEDRAFASSTLEAKGEHENLKLLKVEIGLNFIFPEWTVRILIYEKIADKDMRPDNPPVKF